MTEREAHFAWLAEQNLKTFGEEDLAVHGQPSGDSYGN